MKTKIVCIGTHLKDADKKKLWKKIEDDAFKNDKNYVPTMSFFKPKPKEKKEFLVLYVDNKPVGRAMVTVDKNWISRKKENIGFIDDFIIDKDYEKYADLLIERCIEILKERKINGVMPRYLLPAIQVTDCDMLPQFGLSHTPAWYKDIFIRNDFKKIKEWSAYRLKIPKKIRKSEIENAKKVMKELNIGIEELNTRDTERVKEYNQFMKDTFHEHFGFNPKDYIPTPDSKLQRMALYIFLKILKFKFMIGVDKKTGKIMGTVIYFPDLNIVFRAILDSKWNILRALCIIRKTKRARIDAGGMVGSLRNKGLITGCLGFAFDWARKEHFEEADTGPIMLDNLASMGVVEKALKQCEVINEIKYHTYFRKI